MNPVISPARQARHRLLKLLAQGYPPQARPERRCVPGPLHSTFALEHLTVLARRCMAPEFVLLMAPVFGLDIAPPGYLKLQTALQQGQVANPQWRIIDEGFYPAEYDSRERVVRIHGAALDYVQRNPDAAWELLEILLYEFGHHLDTVLREDFADERPVYRDAPTEEGSRYVQRIASAGWPGQALQPIARYLDANGQPLVIELEPHRALKRIAARRLRVDSPVPGIDQPGHEHFEASTEAHDTFSHERIEKSLTALGLTEAERQALYFGNWLRDYSQLLDPKLVRAAQMPKNFPQVLSRDALTEIVDILAARKFAELRLQDPDSFKVTRERLGVYRPSEHIDNPRIEPPAPFDPAERDADFEPWRLAGDERLQVDPHTSIKRYLQHSLRFMNQQLELAMQHGRTHDGLRHFGAALHVLEDLFAHSNLVELSLIKLGHAVLPWTSPAEGKWPLPLVTGRFGGTDIIASLAQPIARLIAPTENWQFTPWQPGDRSDTDRLLLVLLSEYPDQAWLQAYEEMLRLRDSLSASAAVNSVHAYTWMKTAPLRLLTNAYNTVQQGMLTLLGESIDDAQTLLGGDPNTSGSTDPSHSQLAKDHVQHPLHEPAALLACEAVGKVAGAMLDYWQDKPGEDPRTVAGRYFTHPNDSDWQDALLTQWAASHPAQIERANSSTEMHKLQDDIHQLADSSLKSLVQESRSTWDYINDHFKQWLNKLPGPDEGQGA
ncbi:HET-C-related protein [Pseudomonas syringae]|nr:hypothetical protein [Pseudomonas syringae]